MLLRLVGPAWLSFLLLSAPLVLAVAPARAATSDKQNSAQAMAVSQIVSGIISYTRWPAGLLEQDNLHLCLTGAVEHAEYLGYHSTVIDARRIVVRRRAVTELPATCNVVYVGMLSGAERDALARNLIGQPILVISEHKDSCGVASMFCLAVTDKRVTFEINLDAVARSGIRVHPSVLKLARPQERP